MKDAGYFRAQVTRWAALQRSAKRADVPQALPCSAQAYEAAARGIEQAHGAPRGCSCLACLPLMGSMPAALLRTSLAFRLPLG